MWQPIESAPKDRTIVLFHRLWKPAVLVGCFRDPDWIAFEGQTGWYVVGIPPSHWTDLPKIEEK